MLFDSPLQLPFSSLLITFIRECFHSNWNVSDRYARTVYLCNTLVYTYIWQQNTIFHTLKNHQAVVIYSDFLKPNLHPLTSRSRREQKDSVVLERMVISLWQEDTLFREVQGRFSSSCLHVAFSSLKCYS